MQVNFIEIEFLLLHDIQQCTICVCNINCHKRFFPISIESIAVTTIIYYVSNLFLVGIDSFRSGPTRKYDREKTNEYVH